MGLLSGKRILVTGALTSGSIAYGIARACHREGALLAFSYQNERLARRVQRLAAEFGDAPCLPCDVASDDEITGLFDSLALRWTHLDGVVHSLAFAPAEGVTGHYLDGLSRESFRIAHDISSYSFSALAKAARPLMRGREGALLTLSYIGARRAITGYNMMGLAKASLESGVRYLADALGQDGTRVNAISAGPIRTLAASGIENFDALEDKARRDAPNGRNVTIEQVGDAASFLLSSMASGINGQITYVDGGSSLK